MERFELTLDRLTAINWAQNKRRYPFFLLFVTIVMAITYLLWQTPETGSFNGSTSEANKAPALDLPSTIARPKSKDTKRPVLTFEAEDFEIEGEFDGTSLASVCANTEWQEGLYFDCSNNSGGIGNMRSFLLTCVRYAIDAGAGLIQPTIRKRSDSQLGDLFSGTYLPLGYMFDESFFLETMQTYCPQMKIAKNRDSIPNAENQFYKNDVVAREMANHLDNDGHGFDANRWAGTFREDMDWWLHNTYGHVPSLELPVVLGWRWAFFFNWPIWLDGPEFANTFGRLLKIRPDVARLASKIVKNLQSMSNETEAARISPKLLDFVGVHLRIESDCLDWWPKEADQISHYVGRMQDLDLKAQVIYVATGLQSGLEHFDAAASSRLQSKSYTKEALLNDEDSVALKRLQWDQQALVDYLVLLRARYFLGMFQSSFSQNIASRRHLLRDGTKTLIWRGYHDEYSYLYGLRRQYNGDTLVS